MAINNNPEARIPQVASTKPVDQKKTSTPGTLSRWLSKALRTVNTSGYGGKF